LLESSLQLEVDDGEENQAQSGRDITAVYGGKRFRNREFGGQALVEPVSIRWIGQPVNNILSVGATFSSNVCLSMYSVT
jgi:hypothetical protein